jgi:hypothetical protein
MLKNMSNDEDTASESERKSGCSVSGTAGDYSPPICDACKKTPGEIDEYIDAAVDYGTTPDEYVRREDGTYSWRTNRFLCTECYVAAGCPKMLVL